MKRIITFILVFSLILTLLVIPSFAVDYGQGREVINPIYDTSSVQSWRSYIGLYNSPSQEIFSHFYNTFGMRSNSVIESGLSAFVFEVFNLWFSAVGYGEIPLAGLNITLQGIRSYEHSAIVDYILSLSPSTSNWSYEIKQDTRLINGVSTQIYRIWCKVSPNTGYWVVDSSGGFPYSLVPESEVDVDYRWVSLDSDSVVLDSSDYLIGSYDMQKLKYQWPYYYLQSIPTYIKTIGPYSYLCADVGADTAILTIRVGNVYYAPHYVKRNDSAAPGTVSYDGKYVFNKLLVSDPMPTFYTVTSEKLQLIANSTPDCSVVRLDFTASDGTAYPLVGIVAGDKSGPYSIDYKSSYSNFNSSLSWLYHSTAQTERLFQIADAQLGIPFVMGGRDPSTGFDCSGFVSYCITQAGIANINHTAQWLYNWCTPVSAADAMPGDLVFFEHTYDSPDRITHVGIYAGDGRMIQAGGGYVQYTNIATSSYADNNPQYGRIPVTGLITNQLVVARLESTSGGDNNYDYTVDNTYNYYYDNSSNDNGVDVYEGGTYVESQFINEDNSTVINIAGGNGFGATGGDCITLYLDDLLYDPLTKTYSTYSHSYFEYDRNGNTYVSVSYNYEYNFFVNYTSITYIGTTANANETYHFYYSLPDGRSSADLSAEELLYLDTALDCTTYIRGSDDTSVRSLYHFDGNNRDSSYWNYCTDFVWSQNASITYIDAGVNFMGALYLDELSHQFSCVLPSPIAASDFTIEFRLYSSSTLTPQLDSFVCVGTNTLMYFTGNKFLNKNQTVIGDQPVGSWVAICIQRYNGVLYYYSNGVLLGSINDSTIYDGDLEFTFGTDQQTFKYFDELRILNRAIYTSHDVGSNSYIVSSIPFSTNLALVLPDSQIPVADEYWSISNDTQTNLLSDMNLDWWDGRADHGVLSNSYLTPAVSGTQSCYMYINGVSSASTVSGGKTTVRASSTPFVYNMSFHSLSTGTVFSLDSELLPLGNVTRSSNSYNYISGTSGFNIPFLNSADMSGTSFNRASLSYYYSVGDYTLTLVSASGGAESFTFSVNAQNKFDDFNIYGRNRLYIDNTHILSGYIVTEYASWIQDSQTAVNGRMNYGLAIIPTVDAEPIVYMELVADDHSDIQAEYVTSVMGMDMSSLDKPLLAVRTDVPITKWNIGGIRPSVPSIGYCWCLVESGYIRSIQVFDGYGWVECDGRIWTGSRWTPFGSYNVITMNDLLDIVGSDGSYDPVYTDTGFFAWFQRSWNVFIEKINQIYNAILNIGGDTVTVNIDDSDIVIDNSDDSSDPSSLLEIAKTLFGGFVKLTTKTLEVFVGGISNLSGGFDSVGSFFGLYDPDNHEGIYFIPLPTDSPEVIP